MLKVWSHNICYIDLFASWKLSLKHANKRQQARQWQKSKLSPIWNKALKQICDVVHKKHEYTEYTKCVKDSGFSFKSSRDNVLWSKYLVEH